MQGVVYLVVQGVVQGCGWLFLESSLLLLPPPCASRLCITSSVCAAGLYKGRRREVEEEEEEERGGYVRYRVLPPEWAPRIHMISFTT